MYATMISCLLSHSSECQANFPFLSLTPQSAPRVEDGGVLLQNGYFGGIAQSDSWSIIAEPPHMLRLEKGIAYRLHTISAKPEAVTFTVFEQIGGNH